MKKSIFAFTMLLSVVTLVSCGGKKEKDEPVETKDTTAVVEKQVVKNFGHYYTIADGLKVEGLELNLVKTYSDTASKYFYFTYGIKDAKAKGADEIQVNANSVAKLGNKEDVVVASLADFEKVQTKTKMAGVTYSDFKEVKKNDVTFYYYTMKGVSDQMGGNKNYNKLFGRAVIDDVYMDIMVKVLDNKAELTKAEDILHKVMDVMTK